MDKFVIRGDPEPPRLPARGRSLLVAYETLGRVLPSHRRSLRELLLASYTEIGSFPQSYPRNELSRLAINIDVAMIRSSWLHSLEGHDISRGMSPRLANYSKRPCVSCIDFDSKGIYLASVNGTGSLSIHEFETLYCSAAKGSYEEHASFIRYFSTDRMLEAVRWNPGNQDEVAFVASDSNKVYFYDITCDSLLPSEVLKVKANADSTGFRDLNICKYGGSRVLACGRDGSVYIWDRRASKSSYAALSVPVDAGALNSLQLSNDEQVVYAGGDEGFIHSWDLRGGKRAAAFVACGEVYYQPLGTVKLATELSRISSLRAQTEILASAVHAISLDSSSGHRLAFHLNNGWSGVMDIATLDITHLHCPPPPWLANGIDETASATDIGTMFPSRLPRTQRRRPVWIPSLSVYAVGSALEAQVHMLDFSLSSKSPYFVDRDGADDVARGRFEETAQKPFAEQRPTDVVPTTGDVVAIAAHPLNDHLVAGTQCVKLLLLGQRKWSSGADDATRARRRTGAIEGQPQ